MDRVLWSIRQEKSSIKKFEKQFTISSLLKRKFIWLDETDQDHRGDLMEQSAMCQIWLMCPFRNLTGDLIPTSTEKSSPEDSLADTSCGKIFPVNCFLFCPWTEVIFFCPILCFDLIWIALSWPKDIIYDRP